MESEVAVETIIHADYIDMYIYIYTHHIPSWITRLHIYIYAYIYLLTVYIHYSHISIFYWYIYIYICIHSIYWYLMIYIYIYICTCVCGSSTTSELGCASKSSAWQTADWFFRLVAKGYPLVICDIAIEYGSFIVDLAIKDGDLKVRYVNVYQRLAPKNYNYTSWEIIWLSELKVCEGYNHHVSW